MNTNGADPTCNNPQFFINGSSGFDTILTSTTYRVIACRDDYLPSAVAVFSYTVTPTAPDAGAPQDASAE